MTTEAPLIVSPNDGKIVQLHDHHEKNKTLFVVLGVDTLGVITRLTLPTTGEPKAAIIRQCYGLQLNEDDVESAPLPDGSTDYPAFSVRVFVDRRDFFAAKVYAGANHLRTACNDLEGSMITYLGFTPAKLEEAQ